MTRNPLLTNLRSNKFILYVALFAVLFLTPNTYYVFYELCKFISPYREIASAGASLIVASFVMIYTLRKNFFVAKMYSYFEVTISSYYYITTIGLDWALIPAFGFTIMLPLSVYFCSIEVDKSEVYNESELFPDELETNIESELNKTFQKTEELLNDPITTTSPYSHMFALISSAITPELVNRMMDTAPKMKPLEDWMIKVN